MPGKSTLLDSIVDTSCSDKFFFRVIGRNFGLPRPLLVSFQIAQVMY